MHVDSMNMFNFLGVQFHIQPGHLRETSGHILDTFGRTRMIGGLVSLLKKRAIRNEYDAIHLKLPSTPWSLCSSLLLYIFPDHRVFVS